MASSPDISYPRPTPPWRQKLAAFWRWWSGELSQMVPDSLARTARVPVLEIEGDEAVLVEPRAPNSTPPRASLEDSARARGALRTLLEGAGETRSRARLRLPRGAALVRRVTMPAATEENLAQVIGFEMDRLTPFRADEVYFDQRVVGRDPAAGQVVAQIAVARRELVDAQVARLRALGVSVQGVSVAEEGAPAGAALDLLPTEQRGQRETANERNLRLALIGAVVVLLAIALLLPVWQKRETVIALLPMVAKAKQDAEATDAIAKDLERQVGDYNYLLTKKHAPGALAFIEDVSRLLPDNTWVQQFDLKTAGKNREVQITGETASSSRLIEILEQSTLLQNAAPRGTITRGSPGMERFMIAAEARPRPLPGLRPASEVAVTPGPAPRGAAAAVDPAGRPAETAGANDTGAEAPPPPTPKASAPAEPPKATLTVEPKRDPQGVGVPASAYPKAPRPPANAEEARKQVRDQRERMMREFDARKDAQKRRADAVREGQQRAQPPKAP